METKLTLGSVRDYLAYLEAFPIEGISFSGGEPFLVFDRLIEYLTEIRRAFGRRHYIWLYTSGDGVTAEGLARLKEAGLDEIRFDLAARNYDLAPMTEALEIFDTVTVEIPAIPEDTARVTALLPTLERLGVKHLNLHQLMANEHNQRALTRRGYSVTLTALYDNFLPVVESELAGLEIQRRAAEAGLRLSVNYCSKCYKERFQTRGFRSRYAPLCMKRTESLTRTFFLRSVSCRGTKSALFTLRQCLAPAQGAVCGSVGEGSKPILLVPDACLEDLVASCPHQPIDITYYNVFAPPRSKECRSENTPVRFGECEVEVAREVAFHYTLENPTAQLFFLMLFVENRDVPKTVALVMDRFGIDEEQRAEVLADVRSFYEQFAYVEYLPEELPDYD
jgi:hypothetical protein